MALSDNTPTPRPLRSPREKDGLRGERRVRRGYLDKILECLVVAASLALPSSLEGMHIPLGTVPERHITSAISAPSA